MCSAATSIQTTAVATAAEPERLSPTIMTQRIINVGGGCVGGGAKLRRGPSTFSDDELESSQISQHVTERIKSDRMLITKPEEDHRRRTIIVEKKNGSYGFTLQSYGIHYKKVQEVEMITYVDFVEYDGPAYKAGMREGDVILSINGTDMEKSDHKTLVNFIKGCDSYMRMVVLFEDCVRKVGLHMRYIQLQNVMQSKMAELDRVCIKERELLQGKWKTHSLPARKKATSSPTAEGNDRGASPSDTEKPMPYYRPTLSTEDVNATKPKPNIIPPPAQFMLAYHYLDPNCRYILRPSTTLGSGEYLVSIGPPARSRSDYQPFLKRVPSTENTNTASQTNLHQPPPRSPSVSKEQSSQCGGDQSKPQQSQNPEKENQGGSKTSRHIHGHFCNPCVRHSSKDKNDNGDKDNVSLEAYDLASPCCEPHCVPTKRRSRHHKEHHHKHKHRENKERPQRPKSQSSIPPTPPNPRHSHHEKHNHRPRYYDLNAGLTSHCSLHSCTSSEANPGADTSAASYSTSLSTDTLYWEPQANDGSNAARPQIPPKLVRPNMHQHQFIHRYYPHPAQIQPAPPQGYYQHYVHKPKSWDNLTTKAFGGYGFGYGYLDTVNPKPAAITNKLQAAPALPQQRNSMPRKNSYTRYSAYGDVENYAPPPAQFIQHITKTTTTTTTITAKSTENLIGTYSDSSLFCDCLENGAPVANGGVGTMQQQAEVADSRGYYSSLNNPRSVNNTTTAAANNRGISTTSEITRL